jgi:hypothetical protein
MNDYFDFKARTTSPKREGTSWDLIEFDQPMHEGIEVREHATLGDFLRELQPAKKD